MKQLTAKQIRIYSQDYQQILLTTDSYEHAEHFVRDFGEDWLGLVIDDRGFRWSGRLIVREDGTTYRVHARDYLKYMTWPEIKI